MARRDDDILDRLIESLSIRGILFHPATLFVIASFVMVGGAIFLWERHRGRVVNLNEYQLTPDKILVNEPPVWASTNMKQLVIEGAAIRNGEKVESASLLDTQLVSRTANVMQSVGYVERVKSIQKSKTGLEIDLVYRKPVAVVELSRNTFPFEWPAEYINGDILQPVDRLGVVMPVSLGEGIDLPKILVVYPIPSLPKYDSQVKDWSDWPDQRIKDAAAIGALFGNNSNAIGVARIMTYRKPDQVNVGQIPFELWPNLSPTTGTTVLWGNAPGKEVEGEAKASVKIQALEEFVVRFGRLNQQRRQTIDVRTGKVILANDTKTATNVEHYFSKVK